MEIDNSFNELYHYGVPGMKWGHRKAQERVQKRTAINRYRNEYNKSQIGKSSLSRAYSKLTGADKIYAQSRYNMSKSSRVSSKSSSNTSGTKQGASNSKPKTSTGNKAKKPKRVASSGKKKAKKALQKTGNIALKTTGVLAANGLRAIQNYGNMQRIKYWTNDL